MATTEDRAYDLRYSLAVAGFADLTRAATILRSARAVIRNPAPSGALLDHYSPPVATTRLGVLAGTFNPLTMAHVALARSARAKGRLERIIWTVAAQSVDKEAVTRASLADRLLQLSLRVSGGPDGCGIVNRGLYVEQARIMRNLTPSAHEVVMIVGFDKILQVLDARYYTNRDRALEELFSLAKFLVAPRGRDDEASLLSLRQRPENRRFKEYIEYCPLPRRFRDDSSTLARAIGQTAAMGRRVRSVLSPEGLALARLPGVYAHDGAGAAQRKQVRDTYAERQIAIERLASAE
ncbi:MAG TPA: hypothetical protein VF808_04710 [Ktedonobacterales bacterium]